MIYNIYRYICIIYIYFGTHLGQPGTQDGLTTIDLELYSNALVFLCSAPNTGF